jgi:hypothetical protein
MLNFLESRGLAMEVTKWFDHPTPRPRVSPTWISRALGKRMPDEEFAAERRCVWIGEQACVESGTGHIKVSIQGRRRALPLRFHRGKYRGWVSC